MPKAKKLPSGSWRIRVFDHEEIITLPDGSIKKKNIMKSFTVADPSPAGRRECERLAAEYAINKNVYAQSSSITVHDAIDSYIKLKTGILSPATIRSYKSQQKSSYDMINHIRIDHIRNSDLQLWINDLASDHSPKSVKNIWGLFSAAIDMYAPNLKFKVSFPMQKPASLYTPSDSDISSLLSHVNGSTLEKAILLAAFGTLRRGEICAITSDDVHGNFITVNKSMVYDGTQYVIKSPKTESSYRTIEMNAAIIDKISGTSGRIVPLTPNALTNEFRRAVIACGLPHFRFHDLRHYSASIMHAIGIPDQYIIDRGGWKTDRVMKRVYRDVIDEEKKRFTSQINDHFSSLLDTKLDTKSQEP